MTARNWFGLGYLEGGVELEKGVEKACIVRGRKNPRMPQDFQVAGFSERIPSLLEGQGNPLELLLGPRDRGSLQLRSEV